MKPWPARAANAADEFAWRRGGWGSVLLCALAASFTFLASLWLWVAWRAGAFTTLGLVLGHLALVAAYAWGHLACPRPPG